MINALQRPAEVARISKQINLVAPNFEVAKTSQVLNLLNKLDDSMKGDFAFQELSNPQFIKRIKTLPQPEARIVLAERCDKLGIRNIPLETFLSVDVFVEKVSIDDPLLAKLHSEAEKDTYSRADDEAQFIQNLHKSKKLEYQSKINEYILSQKFLTRKRYSEAYQTFLQKNSPLKFVTYTDTSKAIQTIDFKFMTQELSFIKWLISTNTHYHQANPTFPYKIGIGDPPDLNLDFIISDKINGRFKLFHPPYKLALRKIIIYIYINIKWSYKNTISLFGLGLDKEIAILPFVIHSNSNTLHLNHSAFLLKLSHTPTFVVYNDKYKIATIKLFKELSSTKNCTTTASAPLNLDFGLDDLEVIPEET